MNFLVVPGADGSIQVIDTARELRELVKMTVKVPLAKPLEVRDQLQVASWKVASVANAA
jgi:hypothetical protein